MKSNYAERKEFRKKHNQPTNPVKLKIREEVVSFLIMY